MPWHDWNSIGPWSGARRGASTKVSNTSFVRLSWPSPPKPTTSPVLPASTSPPGRANCRTPGAHSHTRNNRDSRPSIPTASTWSRWVAARRSTSGKRTTSAKVRTYKPLIQKALFRITGVTYWTVAFSPDGRTIAAGSSDGQITVWNTDSPEPRLGFDALDVDENVWAVAFAPDGTLWANDGRDGLKRWSISGQKPKLIARAFHRRALPRAYCRCWQFPGTGSDSIAAIAPGQSANGTEARLRSSGAGTQAAGCRISHSHPRKHTSRPPGPRASRESSIFPRTVSLSTSVLPAPTATESPSHSPPPTLFTSDGDGNVRTWHRDTGMQIGLPIRFSGEVTKIRFRPNSDEFAVPAGDSIFLCSVPDPPYDVVTAGYGRRLRGLDISPRGDRVAVSDDDGFELFDPFTRRRLQRVDYNFCWPYYRRQEQPLTMRFDPDPSRPRVFRGTRGGFDRLAVPDGVRAQAVPSFRLGHVNRIDLPKWRQGDCRRGQQYGDAVERIHSQEPDRGAGRTTSRQASRSARLPPDPTARNYSSPSPTASYSLTRTR